MRRKQSKNYTFYGKAISFALLLLAASSLSYLAWISDLYVLDRRMFPWITALVITGYSVLVCWAVFKLAKRFWPRMVNLAEVETAATMEVAELGPIFPVMVIDKPRMKKRLVRGIELFFSVSAWALFVYFCQTLITAFLWVIGGDWISRHIFSAVAVEGTITMLNYSLYYAGFIFVLLFSWANWNYWRFGRLERRKPRPSVSDAAAAINHGVSLKTLYTARDAKLLYIMPTEAGVVLTVSKYISEKTSYDITRRAV